MSHFLLILGLLLFAYACRTFHNRWIGKLGWLAVLGATYLVGFFLTDGRHVCGGIAVSLWFFFPWVEILGRVRKLRFPLHSQIKHRFPPSREIFPDLEEITQEVESAGFVKADDAGWKWEETDHFIRLFYHAEKRMQATISVAQQGDFVFSHASLTTRTSDGQTLVTTNYPLSFTMKLAPAQRMNRCQEAETLEDMIEAHEMFLQREGKTPAEISAQDPDNLHLGIQSDLTQQIDHNLRAGVIVPTDSDHFRYSWRGCFFLWTQVVKDMIRI